MVSFHRIPICGSTKHTSVRRLRLPPVDKEVLTASGTAPGTSIDAINDVIGGDSIDVDAIDVDVDSSVSEVVRGKRRRCRTTTGTSTDVIDGDSIDVDVDSSVSEVVRGKRRKCAEPAKEVNWWCFGCSRALINIESHLESSPLTSYCRVAASYQKQVGSERVGDRLQWTPVEVSFAQYQSTGRLFSCLFI